MHESIRNSKWAFALVYNPKPKMFQIQIISSSSLYIQFLAIHLQGFIDLQALKIRPHQQDGTDDDQEDDGSNAAALQRYKMVDARLRRLCEKKPSGRCKVPQSIHDQWAAGGRQRDELRALLEEYDFDKELFPSQTYVGTLEVMGLFYGYLNPCTFGR